MSGDNDYYKFIITTGGTLTMTLTTLPANYQLALLNSTGATLQSSTNSGTTNETIGATVTAGTYYARVYPRNNGAFNAGSCYTLRVQTGTAGRIAVNEIVQLGSDKLSISPNPVAYTTNLLFNSEKTGNAQITITSQQGSIVLTKTITVAEGENIKSLDVSKLPNGFYYIKLQNGTNVQMAKIVVNK